MATPTITDSLILRDAAAIWHPFTQHLTDHEPVPIIKAKDTTLFAADGKCYLDATSSWWCNLHGHGHPKIAEKIAAQALNLEHVMFADFTHLPAIELAEKLLKILPGDMQRIFYSDNGSTAVETALKIAFQYWHNKNIKKQKLIAFQGGYHGDTFGAMAAGGKGHFNRPFWPYLFEVALIVPPLKGQEELSLHQLKMQLDEGDAAAFIYEPLVQGAAGMVMHTADGLNALLKLCKEKQTLTIADEVMTGFGRTGPLFASDYVEQKPDLICLSKGLTGGFCPLAVTACREEIYEAFLSERRIHAFLHGHTFSANPIGCASALASLELLLEPSCQDNRERINRLHQSFIEEHSNKWQRAEVLGTILALQYKLKNAINGYFSEIRIPLSRLFKERQVVLRPLGDTVHVIPPYCITDDELKTIYTVLLESLEIVDKL